MIKLNVIGEKLVRNTAAYYCLVALISIAGGTLGGTLAGVGAHMLLSEESKISGNLGSIDDDDIFINENGELCKSYGVGEHKITIIDSNESEYKSVPGYTINTAELNDLFSGDKIEYVNTDPVIAVGSLKEDGTTLEFKDFGESVKEKHVEYHK